MNQEIVPQSVVGSGDNTATNDKLKSGLKGNPNGPVMVNGEYNEAGHFTIIERQVERDMQIPEIIKELGAKACPFIEVSKKMGYQLHLTYHPNPTGNIGSGLKWIDVPAMLDGNASRFHKDISNKRVFWYHKVLKGPIMPFINACFQKAIMENEYKNDLKKFAISVAKFIENHPHEDARVFKTYISWFLGIIQAVDSKIPAVNLQNIGVQIAFYLKRFVNYKHKDLTGIALYKAVMDTSARYSIKQCFTEVHRKLERVDTNAEKAQNLLDDIDARAELELEQERKEKEAKMNAFNRMMEAANNANKIEDSHDSNDSRSGPVITEVSEDPKVQGKKRPRSGESDGDAEEREVKSAKTDA